MSKIVIIGGGPAGMIAGITAAENGNNVTILEKMNSFGKKLSITGKGRCNITNNIDISEFIKNTPGNGKFLYGAFNNYTNRDIINFFEENGVKTKVERGERVFPISDDANEVVESLVKKLKSLNVNLRKKAKVQKININTGKVTGVTLENGEVLNAEKVILATGGKSYPVTRFNR